MYLNDKSYFKNKLFVMSCNIINERCMLFLQRLCIYFPDDEPPVTQIFLAWPHNVLPSLYQKASVTNILYGQPQFISLVLSYHWSWINYWDKKCPPIIRPVFIFFYMQWAILLVYFYVLFLAVQIVFRMFESQFESLEQYDYVWRQLNVKKII